jgi:hypothetical protein
MFELPAFTGRPGGNPAYDNTVSIGLLVLSIAILVEHLNV